ncbi:E3 ubiquitin-protein ligase mib2 [Bulinus truncatus]|nr:E3 ubiquitin-protein ligase mib2 [Bulinus truncatus]
MKKSSVKVVRDSGEKNIYRAGTDGSYDLFLYDSAPSGVKHEDICCGRVPRQSHLRDMLEMFRPWGLRPVLPCYHADKHDTTYRSFLRIDKDSCRPLINDSNVQKL